MELMREILLGGVLSELLEIRRAHQKQKSLIRWRTCYAYLSEHDLYLHIYS